MMESQAGGVALRRRLYQALGAYGQALTIAPDEPATYQRLVPLYLGFNKMDLALHARDEYQRISGQDFPRPSATEAVQQWDAMWTQLEDQVEKMSTQANDYIEQGQPRLDVVLFAWQNGCTRLALDLIDADPALAAENPEVRRLRALLLLESAKPEQAFERLVEMESQAPPEVLGELREPLAYASLALPDFKRAKALWRDQAAEASEGQMMAAMQAVPFVGALNGPSRFPIVQTTISAQSMTALPQKVAENEMNAILCDLEAGEIEDAEKALATLLVRHPLTQFTPLAGFYLQQIRGKPVQITIPPRGNDRYAAVEESLDDAAVKEQIADAGPVEATRPKPSDSQQPNNQQPNAAAIAP
jgi:tetratricopeptide (TPR) repeat protein